MELLSNQSTLHYSKLVPKYGIDEINKILDLEFETLKITLLNVLIRKRRNFLLSLRFCIGKIFTDHFHYNSL